MGSRNRIRQKLIGYLSVMLSSIALVLASADSATAATATNTPDVYKITFELRFRKQGEAAFPTSSNVTGTDLDITGVAPGGTTATLQANVALGDYDKAKATLTCTVKLKGSVAFGGTTYYTTSGGGVSTNAADLNEGSYSLPAALCSGGTSVDFESPTFSPPLTIGGTLSITFDAAGALQLDFTGIPPAGAQLSPGPFSASMTTQ